MLRESLTEMRFRAGPPIRLGHPGGPRPSQPTHEGMAAPIMRTTRGRGVINAEKELERILTGGGKKFAYGETVEITDPVPPPSPKK